MTAFSAIVASPELLDREHKNVGLLLTCDARRAFGTVRSCCLRSPPRRTEAISSHRPDPAHRAVSQLSGETAPQVDGAAPCLAERKLEAVGLEVRAERPLTRPQ